MLVAMDERREGMGSITPISNKDELKLNSLQYKFEQSEDACYFVRGLQYDQFICDSLQLEHLW